MKRLPLCILLMVASIGAAADDPSGIRGWQPNTADHTYLVGIDHSDAYSGSASAHVVSRSASPPVFGGIHQNVNAEQYRGKRVRFTGFLKTKGVKDWAGLWIRADDSNGNVLEFDNMQTSGRSIHGDTDWQKYSEVMDVPADARTLFFGAVLLGSGEYWFDAAQLEVVDQSVAVTTARFVAVTSRNPVRTSAGPLNPINMDFEE